MRLLCSCTSVDKLPGISVTLCWFPPVPPFLTYFPSNLSFPVPSLPATPAPLPPFLPRVRIWLFQPPLTRPFTSDCSCSPFLSALPLAAPVSFRLPRETSCKVRPECIHRNMFDKDCPYVHLLMFSCLPSPQTQKRDGPQNQGPSLDLNSYSCKPSA